MTQFQEKFWTDEQTEGRIERGTEGQILFHRTITATVRGPIAKV